jgi:hypothetical protein
MSFLKAVMFAAIAFIIFDAALFGGTYVHQLGYALRQIAHLDWKWL